jgi:hypothetical protein
MGYISKYQKKEFTDAIAAEGTANKLKIALFTSSHPYASAPSQQKYSDIIANECSGAGYNAGGILLTGVTSALTGDNAKLTANNVVYTPITTIARYAVVYNTDTSLIRGQYDLGGDKNVSGGTLTVTWNAGGLLTLL